MAAKLLTRTFAAITRSGRSPSAILSIYSHGRVIGRHGMSSSTNQADSNTETASKPRWQETPPLMKAPVRLRGSPDQPEFPVNSDPARLDQFYNRVLGQGGEEMLSEEVKWQIVTHKSFDQGRRGFNERLSFLGKQIVQLQASLAILQEVPRSPKKPLEDPYGRTPFQHAVLEGLDMLGSPVKETRMNKKKIATLARQYGLDDVLRWVPKDRTQLSDSGIDVILTQAMYAVVGAVALEKGGLVANQKARDCILKPLGFKIGMS